MAGVKRKGERRENGARRDEGRERGEKWQRMRLQVKRCAISCLPLIGRSFDKGEWRQLSETAACETVACQRRKKRGRLDKEQLFAV